VAFQAQGQLVARFHQPEGKSAAAPRYPAGAGGECFATLPSAAWLEVGRRESEVVPQLAQSKIRAEDLPPRLMPWTSMLVDALCERDLPIGLQKIFSNDAAMEFHAPRFASHPAPVLHGKEVANCSPRKRTFPRSSEREHGVP